MAGQIETGLRSVHAIHECIFRATDSDGAVSARAGSIDSTRNVPLVCVRLHHRTKPAVPVLRTEAHSNTALSDA